MSAYKKLRWLSQLMLITGFLVMSTHVASQDSAPEITNMPVLKAMPLRLQNDFSKTYKLPDDLEGNGFSSIFWINRKTNQFAYWTMGVRQQKSPVGYISNYVGRTGGSVFSIAPGYSVAAMGDFDGNGLPDLIWTSGANDLEAWFKNDGDSGYTQKYIGAYPQGLRLIGAGDIDGDGIADLIFHDDSSCQLSYWIMRGEKVVRKQSIDATCGYHVAAIGDISGNGLLDIVWVGPENDVLVWYGDGSSFKSIHGGSYPINSELMAVGVFDATLLNGWDIDHLVQLDRFNLITRDKATGQLNLMEWIADKPGAKVTSGKINLISATNPKDNIRYTYHLGPVTYMGAYPGGGRYANTVTILSGADDTPPSYFSANTFRLRSMQWSSDSGFVAQVKSELSDYPAGEYIPYVPINEVGYSEDWEIVGSSVGR